MGWIQRVFGGARQKSISLREVGRLLATGAWSNTALLEQYGKSVYVFASVNKIAQKIASIELKLLEIKNSKGEVNEFTSHEILDLLYRCNPFQTKNEFWKTTVLNKKLAGEAFWLKVRGPRNKVVELWNIRPDLVTVVTDPEKYILRYEVANDAGGRDFVAPENIVHFKDPDPLNLHRGISPLRPAQSRVETEQMATGFQRDFFKNNARPDALLITDDSLAAEQKDELKSSWNAKHKGPGKNSQISILEGGIHYQQIAVTQREMDYVNSLNFTRDDILVAFGVPKSIITTDDVNRANAQEGMRTFLAETIVPEMTGMVEVINEMLVIPDFGERLYLDFVDPTPADRQMELNEFTAGVDKWITRNEIRARLSLEPVDGGDTLTTPLGSVPISTSLTERNSVNEPEKIFKGRHSLREKLKLFEGIADHIVDQLKAKTKTAPTGETKENKTSLFKDIEVRTQYEAFVNKKIDQRAKKFRADVENAAEAQMNRVIGTLAKGLLDYQTKASDKPFKFDKEKERKVFSKLELPFITDTAIAAGQDALDLLGSGDFQLTKQLQAILEKRAKMFASSVNDTTLEKLSRTLAEGIASGEGIDELTDRVRTVYKEFPDSRSELIARTETTAANNQGFVEAYQQSSVVKGQEWVATMDDRTRDEHLAMDGEIVEVGQTFSNGLEYPQEPNCRCVLAPVV